MPSARAPKGDQQLNRTRAKETPLRLRLRPGSFFPPASTAATPLGLRVPGHWQRLAGTSRSKVAGGLVVA